MSLFGKKESVEEMRKDVILDSGDDNILHFYILFDRLAGVPVYSPFQAKNESVALRAVSTLLDSPQFKFKPNELSLYHIFTMSENTLEVNGLKKFICYVDEVKERLDKIQGEL